MRHLIILAMLLGGCASPPPPKAVSLTPNFSACMIGGRIDERCAARVDADFTMHREYKLDLLREYQDAFRKQ